MLQPWHLATLQGYAFNATSDFDTVRQLKEALGYVSYDPAIDKKLGQVTQSRRSCVGRVPTLRSHRIE